MKEKLVSHWPVAGLLLAILVIGPLVLATIAGRVCLGYNGFAVDQAGVLYLGRNHEIIAACADGSVLRRWAAPTSRGYRFTILEDRCYLLAGERCYVLDLCGDLLEVQGAEAAPEFRTWPNRSFAAPDGSIYRLRSPFLRTTIVKELTGVRTVVFQMPWRDYIPRLLLLAGSCIAAVSLAALVVRRYTR